MDTNAKIYVAGHTGLVGSALVRTLRQRGYRNIVLRTADELDLRRQVPVEKFFAAERPEYVFLAAAKVGGILANSTYQAEFIYDNLMIAATIIETAYRYGVRKLLNLGSSCIYPKLASQPLTEDALLSGPLEPTNEPYAIAKIAAIKLCRYYNQQYGTDFLSIMPTNLYGPYDNFNLETGHVLPMFVRKCHLARLFDEGALDRIREDLAAFPVGALIEEDAPPQSDAELAALLAQIGITRGTLTLWGSGEPYRELLYSDDLAEAALFLMTRYTGRDIGEFVNVGTGTDMRVRDIAELVKRTVGYEGTLEWDRSKPDGTPRKVLDLSRMGKLGWQARISLEEGVRMLYEWYRSAAGQLSANG